MQCPSRVSKPRIQVRCVTFEPTGSFFGDPKEDLNIVTCFLKAELAEPEETAVARQRLCKHLSAATEADETVEELEKNRQQSRNCWKRCFLCGPPRGYIPGTETELQSVVSSRDCESAASQY
jgi:hypothetical protein